MVTVLPVGAAAAALAVVETVGRTASEAVIWAAVADPARADSAAVPADGAAEVLARAAVAAHPVWAVRAVAAGIAEAVPAAAAVECHAAVAVAAAVAVVEEDAVRREVET